MYLNILQLQQSRTSTFNSRLCDFIFPSAVLQWWSDSQSLADPALAVVIAHHRTVWPGCHTASSCLSFLQESLALPRIIKKALEKSEPAAKNDGDLIPKPFTMQLLFQSSSPVISLWGLTKEKHRQVFIK